MKKVFLLLTISVLLSSYYFNHNETKDYGLTVKTENQTFNINTTKDIENYAFQKLNLSESAIITNAKMTSETDSKGEYHLIRGSYNENGTTVNFGIPLEMNADNQLSESGCIMRCEITNPDYNGKCEQIIYERCRKQTCICDEPNSCNTVIEFTE